MPLFTFSVLLYDAREQQPSKGSESSQPARSVVPKSTFFLFLQSHFDSSDAINVRYTARADERSVFFFFFFFLNPRVIGRAKVPSFVPREGASRSAVVPEMLLFFPATASPGLQRSIDFFVTQCAVLEATLAS